MLDLETKYPLLAEAGTPEQLKKIPAERLPLLAEEVRGFLVDAVSANGGHLASNLGVVELTIALHRVFDCPRDHVIWDVGHQSYVHKIFTERAAMFDTLRKPGGLSGFTKREESKYDCFGAGHSSTSLSAALGFAVSDKLAGSDAHTIAVIGDGSYTGGMIHEALNNCNKDLRLVIVLNENEMSISKNIGRFARNLSRLRIRPGYRKTKKITGEILIHVPLIGKPVYRFVRNTKGVLKDSIYRSNYFENLGIYYIGPLDGNNEADVERALMEAKSINEPVIVHLKTKKGKGYAPAENSPVGYHGVSPDSRETTPAETYSDLMGETLIELAAHDQTLCAITAAMSSGTGLERFRKTYRNRFFDVGIAEEHAVTFAAGLAANGMKPVFAVYSTFLQRAYDQLVHDVALQKLPLILCVDRAGLNQADGPTHHGIFDVSLLSGIPGAKIYTPVTAEGLRRSMVAAIGDSCISAIRYPNGTEDPVVRSEFYADETVTGIGIRTTGIVPGCDAVLITHGRITGEVLRARDRLVADGLQIGVILCEFIKPYQRLASLIAETLPEAPCVVVTVEEEIRSGGFGVCLFDTLREEPVLRNKRTRILATENSFVIQETDEPIWKTAGVSADQIADAVRELAEVPVTAGKEETE